MRVSIICEDNKVNVEGAAETVDCSSLDEEIHAVQWYGTVGEVEFKHDFVENVRRPNERITDFTPYKHLVDLWMIEAQKDAS